MGSKPTWDQGENIIRLFFSVLIVFPTSLHAVINSTIQFDFAEWRHLKRKRNMKKIISTKETKIVNINYSQNKAHQNNGRWCNSKLMRKNLNGKEGVCRFPALLPKNKRKLKTSMGRKGSIASQPSSPSSANGM